MSLTVKSQMLYREDGDSMARISADVSMNCVLERNAPRDIYDRICEAIAERFVAEHYTEIAAKLDQQAIATLAVAEAGAKIRETLERDVAVRVKEVVKTEVYQRGVFGGITRIR